MHTLAPAVQNMGINHGCADILMAKQFLNGTNVIARFQKMRCKRVPVALVFGANSGAHLIKEFGFVRDHKFQLLPFCTRRSVSAVVVDYLRRRK